MSVTICDFTMCIQLLTSTDIFILRFLQDVAVVTPSGKPVTHWRSQLTVSVMSQEFAFDEHAMPSDIAHYLRYVPSERIISAATSKALSL